MMALDLPKTSILAWGRCFFTAMLTLWPVLVKAQTGGIFDQYRTMLGDDNPAIFVVEEGEDYWRTPEGPKQTALTECDLGLGPGRVEGAYAKLPRYFEDTQQVMDLEGRLIYCMEKIQGRDPQAVRAYAYAQRGDMGTELEALVAWIAQQSTGIAVAPPQGHDAERDAYALGETLFYHRVGPHDFSCATCHGQSDKRIRLQMVSNLTSYEGAVDAVTRWPGYRISEGLVRTMGWRVRDCFRQQRLPELVVGSEASVALQVFLAVNASGGVMMAPGLKR